MYWTHVDQFHDVFRVLEIYEYMRGDWLIEIDELELFPSLSWWQKYFQNLIGSCKVTALVLDQLFIFASVLMVSPPHMTSVVSIYFVGITPSLVWIYMIISTCCGSLNLFLCIPICVDGIHISVPTSFKNIFKNTFEKRSNVFNSLSVLERLIKNAFNRLSVLG